MNLISRDKSSVAYRIRYFLRDERKQFTELHFTWLITMKQTSTQCFNKNKNLKTAFSGLTVQKTQVSLYFAFFFSKLVRNVINLKFIKHPISHLKCSNTMIVHNEMENMNYKHS